MWPCCLCQTFRARTLKDLVKHVNMVHSGQPNVDILCAIEGCVSRYTSCKSWHNHVRKRHKDIYEPGSCIQNDDDEIADVLDVCEMDDQEAGGPEIIEAEPNAEPGGLAETSVEQRKKRHARILLAFKEDNRLTQTTTKHFVDCINYFAGDVVSGCCKVFQEIMLETDTDVDIAALHDRLKDLERPLAGLETPWNQAIYFKEVFNCVVSLFSSFIFGASMPRYNFRQIPVPICTEHFHF